MKNHNSEQRTCIRFEIPEATVNYRHSKFIVGLKRYKEESCPVEEISRGGIRFLSRKNLEIDSKIKMIILIHQENFFQIFKGQVKWSSKNPSSEFKYRIGVQFNPYGMKKEENHPKALEKIIALEQKYSYKIQ